MVFSIFFEDVVILDEILWSVWFERKILGSNQMFEMMMYKEGTNLVTFQFGGTSEKGLPAKLERTLSPE